MLDNLIPEQIKGKKVDLFHSENFDRHSDAVICFNRAFKRMLNPRVWHELSGIFSAEFYLMDGSCVDPHRLAKAQDYLKIDIPGPGPSSGKGYDWVRVDQIEDRSDNDAQKESVGMRLTPCSVPANDNENVAHFFAEGASSTFIISRIANIVTSTYHGRNEEPNIKTDSVADNVRNAIVSSGAMASLSEAQWMTLIKAFLQPEIGG